MAEDKIYGEEKQMRDIVAKEEFNDWEKDMQIAYIKDIIGKENIYEDEKEGEHGLLFYGKVRCLKYKNELGETYTVSRVFPYSLWQKTTLQNYLLEFMNGISVSQNQEKKIKLENSKIYIFEIILEVVEPRSKRWPIVCRFYDDVRIIDQWENRYKALQADCQEIQSTYDKYSDSVQKKKEELKSMEKEYETNQKELEKEYKTNQKELEKEYEKKQKELEKEYEKKQKELEKECEKNKKTVEKEYDKWKKNFDKKYKAPIQELCAVAEKYGLPMEDIIKRTEQNEIAEEVPVMDAASLTDYVWSYLWEKKNLWYDRFVIARFLDSLHTEQLTILWGEPGSGKTSLPQAVAEAIGAECRPIAVQPSWSDNHDLLGYYNALEDRYISTPFLESLVEANQHPDKLYLVILDEMNLAHVEYYFSEVLSAMTRDDRTLTLYGQTQNVNLMRLLELDKQGITEENCKEAKDICMKQLYPGKFRIPDNVRFIGTINMDETTKNLSPKVVDRSYPIRVGVLQSQEKEKLQAIVENLPVYERCIISADSFLPKEMDSLDGEMTEKFEEKMEEIQRNADLFRKISGVSNRFYHYINQILLWNQDVDADWLIYDKILSEVRIDESNLEEAKQIAETLKQNDYPFTQKKLNEMIADVNGEQAIGESYYWR